MKKQVGALLTIILIFTLAGCSTNNNEHSTESSETKQETKASKDKEKKLAEEAEKKEKEEQAEKEKQDLIAKKVLEADTAMKAAETNPTDETMAAKEAIESIPDGNSDLQKRLEAATVNLETIKQQATEAQRVAAEQAALQAQQQIPIISSDSNTGYNQEATNQAEIDRQLEENRAAHQPTIVTDESGRQYIYENHDAYKDEPYYTEDWKNNPSPYQ